MRRIEAVVAHGWRDVDQPGTQIKAYAADRLLVHGAGEMFPGHGQRIPWLSIQVPASLQDARGAEGSKMPPRHATHTRVLPALTISVGLARAVAQCTTAKSGAWIPRRANANRLFSVSAAPIRSIGRLERLGIGLGRVKLRRRRPATGGDNEKRRRIESRAGMPGPTNPSPLIPSDDPSPILVSAPVSHVHRLPADDRGSVTLLLECWSSFVDRLGIAEWEDVLSGSESPATSHAAASDGAR
jgi:hypothetical protein